MSLHAVSPVASENSDPSVSMVKSAKDRMRNNISEPRDRARVGRILLERNVSSQFVIIAGIFRKNSAKMLCVDHDQMIRDSRRIDPIKRST